MTLTATWEVTTIQQLQAMHGLDNLILSREKQVQALAHEFEMLAIKMRTLLNIDEVPYSLRDDEFNVGMIIPESINANVCKQIQKIFKRWEDVKQLIKKLDPDFFLSIEEKITKQLSDQIVKEIDQDIINQIMGTAQQSCI